MLKNIIKIAFRNLSKERYYATINIFGLALGMATTLLITSYVLHEVSYDQEHPDVENLYRVNMTNIWMPGGGEWSSTSPPLAGVLAADYPEIEESTRINTPGNNIVRAQGTDMAFYESDILAADSNFFAFFNFPLIYGDAKTALKGIDKVVISKDMAVKYFGKTNVLGETILYGEKKRPLTITGITETQPTNQHFNFDFLLSMYTNPNIKQVEDNWIWTQMVTYVKVRSQTNIAQLEDKLKSIAPMHITPALQRWGINYDEFIAEKGEWTFFLQPVPSIHLKSQSIGNRIGAISDYTYIYIFSFTGAFVLLLAIINFINLATAKASARAKEIGMRKVLGSRKKQLVFQFLLESTLLVCMAGVLSLGISEFLRIIINTYLSDSFVIIDWWYSPYFILAIIGFILIVGFVAGIYPALYLTSFQPGKVLKGQLQRGEKTVWFRNGLVVLQFSISTALMICTFIVYSQLNFFINKDTGYDRNNIIVVNWADKLGTHLEAFVNEIKEHPNVKSASVSLDVIGRGSYEDIFGDVSSGKEQSLAMMKADEHQLKTMGIELIQGRYFDENNPADKYAIVINQSTMNAFGYTEENVIGQKIYYGGDDIGAARVIGVVKDFNFYSLHYPIAPYLFYHIDAPIWGDSRVVSIKTNGNNPGDLLQYLKSNWKDISEDEPFDYSFLNKEYENNYKSEQQLGALFASFTTIAILIACLGLFGLASYTVNNKNKEIGVRKVLGATVSQIVIQFNSKFTKLILLSLVVAMPLAWYAMKEWLSQFQYQTELKVEIFVFAGIIAVAIGLITVSYQSIKASRVNPAKTLKDE